MATGAVAGLAGVAGGRAADRGRSRVGGVRLVDQGTNPRGEPDAGYMPGMDVRAALTVVGDGPVGAVGPRARRRLRPARGPRARRWAVGMKMVVDLPRGRRNSSRARSSTRFGFPGAGDLRLPLRASRRARRRSASSCRRGSTARCAPRTATCSTGCCIPYLWRLARGRHAALVGRQVAAGIGQARRAAPGRRRLRAHRRGLGQHERADRLRRGRGLDDGRAARRGGDRAARSRASRSRGRTSSATYVARRRASWVEQEGRVAERRARRLPARRDRGPDRHGPRRADRRRAVRPAGPRGTSSALPSLEEYFAGRIPADEIARIRDECDADGQPAARRVDGSRGLAGDPVRRPAAGDAPGRAADGRQGAGAAGLRGSRASSTTDALCGTCRDAALRRDVLGPGDHVRRRRRRAGFDREKCVHCGACLGTATRPLPGEPRAARTSSSAPAPAGCIRRRIDGELSSRSGSRRMSTGCFTSSSAAASCPTRCRPLEPVMGPAGPGLKNETMLPAVLDPWAGHALYEAAQPREGARRAARSGSSASAPKAKLQQVMMTVAQKVPFELVALDGRPAVSPTRRATAAALADAIDAIPGLDRSRLLVFGGWESASRGAGATMQMVGERLGITDQFQGVDELTVGADGALRDPRAHRGRAAPGVGVRRAARACSAGRPATCPSRRTTRRSAWRTCARSCRRCRRPSRRRSPMGGAFASAAVPTQRRETRVVKDLSPDEIAQEIVEWIAAMSVLVLWPMWKPTARWPKPALEALTAGAGARGSSWARRSPSAWSARTSPRRRPSVAGVRRGARAWRERRGVRRRRATPPMPRPPRRSCRAAGARSSCVAAGTSRWLRVLAGRRPAPGRPRRHARHAHRGRRGGRVGRALVLPAAHGRRDVTRTERPWILASSPARTSRGPARAAAADGRSRGRRRCRTMRTRVIGVARAGDGRADDPPRRGRCCSSPAPAGPRSRPTARRTCRRPKR